jgi:hypothetical protein
MYVHVIIYLKFHINRNCFVVHAIPNLFYYVRFEDSTVVTMKNAVFWDVAPCRYFINRRFGGTYHLHLQAIRNLRAINQREQVAVD